MIPKMSWVLALVAGFLGGIASQYVSPALVRADVRIPPVQQVIARKFVLVNEHDTTAGVFGFEGDGNPSITLYDAQGQVIWSTKVRVQKIER
ncbi:MAG TPA: hypothetical protein VNM68_12280 [Candidatus Polarisedimenticolia bacterium]|nr:hypothetical protein [Candidatus Polarisedimenticolia bacterium]